MELGKGRQVGIVLIRVPDFVSLLAWDDSRRSTKTLMTLPKTLKKPVVKMRVKKKLSTKSSLEDLDDDRRTFGELESQHDSSTAARLTTTHQVTHPPSSSSDVCLFPIVFT